MTDLAEHDDLAMAALVCHREVMPGELLDAAVASKAADAALNVVVVRLYAAPPWRQRERGAAAQSTERAEE